MKRFLRRERTKEMRWLFLRSAHRTSGYTDPPDRDLDPRSDMWIALFAELVRASGGCGEIWKQGWRYTHDVNINLRIVRYETLGEAAGFEPDVIFNRGGYTAYEGVLAANPEATTIYYGAGERWCPTRRYDLILVDTPAQRAEAAARWPDSRVIIMHKPASPVFKPRIAVGTEYDLIFICDSTAENKGCKWLADRLPADMKLLNIGPADKWLHAEFCTGSLPRHCVADYAGRAKVGVVCDDGMHDSGPRVLSELLAMNIPVIVRECVRADLDFLITPQTGVIANDKNFAEKLRELLADSDAMKPRRFYDRNLSIERCAQKILENLKCQCRNKLEPARA